MISKIFLRNYKIFRESAIEFNPGLNILVGANEAGKSTLVEAVYLALTARSGRYPVASTLTHHLLNKQASEEYIKGIRNGTFFEPPEILIELYFTESEETIALKGTNNILGENCPGIRLWIHYDQDLAPLYEKYILDKADIQSVPIEYYKVEWLAFSGTPISRHSLKVSTSLVDASKIRLSSGADYYLQQIIRESLPDAERVSLARAYSELKQQLTASEGVSTINTTLEQRGLEITDKKLSLSMDVSSTTAWESSLIPHLDDLPVDYVGGGEQSSLKILLALTRQIEGVHIILIEEPENHLSYILLNRLIKKISDLCIGKQLILTTHSSFVLNKLGLKNLLLLKNVSISRMGDLPDDTQSYFKRLSGYDTLRMVLANKIILVEGPSDELIVQRAFRNIHGCRPLEKQIDVISVKGLSFKRFLDIAANTGTVVQVVWS